MVKKYYLVLSESTSEKIYLRDSGALTKKTICEKMKQSRQKSVEEFQLRRFILRTYVTLRNT